jgi:hypothetical protein
MAHADLAFTPTGTKLGALLGAESGPVNPANANAVSLSLATAQPLPHPSSLGFTDAPSQRAPDAVPHTPSHSGAHRAPLGCTYA